MKRYYVKPNYCCGEGNDFTVKDGQVVRGGLDVISVNGARAVQIVEDWCGKFYNRKVDLAEWILVPILPDGEYIYNPDRKTWEKEA